MKKRVTIIVEIGPVNKDSLQRGPSLYFFRCAVIIAFEGNAEFLGDSSEIGQVVARHGDRMVGVDLPFHPAAELEIPMRPLGTAVLRPLLPLLFRRDIRYPAAGGQIDLVIAVGEASPGHDTGNADDHGAGASALLEVHGRLALGPGASQRDVAAPGEKGSQRAGGYVPIAPQPGG